MSSISLLNINTLELISNFLSVNEILSLLLSNKYYYNHLQYILTYLISNKYSISLDELNSSCFKLALIENPSHSVKLYDSVDTSEYCIISTLKIFYVYAKNNDNRIIKLIDYMDDVFNLKYHTRRDIYIYNLFKRMLSIYDDTVEKVGKNIDNKYADLYSNWYELNVNLFILYESFRLLNKRYEISFKQSLLFKKNIIIDKPIYSRQQISFIVLLVHNIDNKKLKVYMMYELFRLIYEIVISNNFGKIMENYDKVNKFKHTILDKIVNIREDLENYPKLIPKYFKNIMIELFINLTYELKMI